MQEVSGRKATWAPIEKADVVSVGSILGSVLRRGSNPIVFGSGLRDAADCGEFDIMPEFISVRGELTRASLGLPGTTPIGDPGITASEIYPSRRSGIRLAVFVPHFSMLGTRSGRAVVSHYRALGYEVALPNLEPRLMADTIARASLVVTTSLHAIVFAHSFGIPVAKATFASEAGEPQFKYQDYSSALGISLREYEVPVTSNFTSTQIIERIEATTDRVAARVPSLIASVYAAGRALI
ncbi:polysaccharide pyruvyl transferase family protein [Microbacterium natoriense]